MYQYSESHIVEITRVRSPVTMIPAKSLWYTYQSEGSKTATAYKTSRATTAAMPLKKSFFSSDCVVFCILNSPCLPIFFKNIKTIYLPFFKIQIDSMLYWQIAFHSYFVLILFDYFIALTLKKVYPLVV